ncbi:hypothetical protein [Aestuariibaculum lutulentum]|uniref:Lipoprotein n=1 Tax=Aestuariibaculum lutulentum TaxID=2920935 RepID=A0ABS9RIJ3_9FLAO|nr:hypothetical protein [Aestuariibaculum lutulentum]MCH4552773.1 hypothetical protein [Aestuariibaculum lutulentum]
MRKFSTLILILLILVSCSQKETKKAESITQKPITKLKLELQIPIEEIALPEQYFEIDSLRSRLESELNELILNPKFNLKIKPIINTHNKTITDTIKTLTFDKTKIQSYKSLKRELICKAEIGNSEFAFLDSIKIGAKKRTLKNIIKSELQSDFIKIGDLEGNSVFLFIFENDTLKTIDYQGYAD